MAQPDLSAALMGMMGGGGGPPQMGGPPPMMPGMGGPPPGMMGPPPGGPMMPPGPSYGPAIGPPGPPPGMAPPGMMDLQSMMGMMGGPPSMPPSMELSGNAPQDLVRTCTNLLQISLGKGGFPPASHAAAVVAGCLRDLAALVGGLSGASEYPVGPTRDNNPTRIPLGERGQGRVSDVPPYQGNDDLLGGGG